jgi:transcriptional antiterminator RfaH
MTDWWVIQVEAQREPMVRLLLMRHGFETYLPRIKLRSRISLLFPTYLFVRVAERFYPILWTPHVIRVLMSGDKPAYLKEEIITSIRKREVGGFVKLPIPRRLKPGQKVQIINGSFQGQIGLYEGMSGRDRERVLLELLGRQVPIEIPSRDIAPLSVAPIAHSHRLR